LNDEPLKTSRMNDLLGYHCRRAFYAVQPFAHERMAQFGLRPADFAVLSLLKVNPNTSQKRIAQGIGVLPPNLAPVIERLEARGLVARKRSERDGRRQLFYLSDSGLALCEEAEQTAFELEEHSCQVLSADEQKQLLALLKKLYESAEQLQP